VTGAASGIGAEVASALKARGAIVVALDVKHPTDIEVDLSDVGSIDAAVAKLPASLDGLANVAGVPGTLAADTVFKVNFLGLRHLTEALIPRLARGGAVVNVASTAGFEWPSRLELILGCLGTSSFDEGADWLATNAPDPDEVAPYHFSKELVSVYTMRKALDLSQRGGRINAVSPGPVETPILGDFEDSMGKELLDGVREMVGRHGTPADIAPLVAFLLSDDAGWVNGQNVMADGGAVAMVVSGAVPSLV
jgi:NAD(P)-dependent dehydrogenase (short-subunit alcohol dehydrogenase family)